MKEDLLVILLEGLGQTAYMVTISTIISLLIGLPLGITLVVTERGHVLESPAINKILGTTINAVRSFPSIILIIVLLPLSRLIVGTTLGSTAAIVPLSVGSAPFVARIIESGLKEVERGKVEAAQAMGAKPLKVITAVLIPEALPSIIRGVTISIITIIGFTAIAGAIGAGGLGSIAIRYGYLRFRNDILLATVLLLIALVQGIQLAGDHLAKRINRKRHKFE
ncbi:MAG: methionine ABC transporter permease [Clostridiaceae bacterium]|nr:methionine ABC transporter permease [Clostridiaceae bacterium]